MVWQECPPEDCRDISLADISGTLVKESRKNEESGSDNYPSKKYG
jgi:hypothetical protein